VSASEIKEVAWLLMLIPFGVVLGTGIFFICCAVRRAQMRRREAAFEAQFVIPTVNVGISSYRPFSFEQPTRWLAVKSNNPRAVQEALHLHHTTPCSWEEGLVEAHEDKLFVSPSISGWILVVGSRLPDPAEDVDICYHFLADLSRKLGHVQFFDANRVLNHHAWALMDKGDVFRAYAWGGETLWNQGPLTAAEKELEMTCYDYGSSTSLFSNKDGMTLNCEKVNQLAARWSVDPNTVPDSAWNAHGVVGEFTQAWPH
jgi:hypothetical protein